MALPSYNKADRRQNFEQLPKGAYVIQIIGAREEANKNGDGTHVTIAFDIAEGDYKGFYKQQFDKNSNEDKKWPNDGTFYLTVPVDGCKPYIWTNWSSFFADLEDSNGGFVFGGDVKTLKGKLIGGKFHIEQSEYNGNVYDHTKLRWTCVADDVRQGKAGKLPADKLIDGRSGAGAIRRETDPFTGTASTDDFVSIPEGAEDEVPF